MSLMSEQQFWDTVFIAAIQGGRHASQASDQAGLAVTFRAKFMHMSKQRVLDSENGNGKTLGQTMIEGNGPFNSGGRD